MTYLDAINAIIGTCGYVPLASLDEEHAFKDAAVSLFDRTLRSELTKGWYFNRVYVSLKPNEQGSVFVTHDVIDFITAVPGYYKSGNQIRRIGDPLGPITTVVSGRLVYSLQFDECPDLFQAWVLASARVQFQTVYDGDSTKTRQLAAEAAAAWSAFHTSEIVGTRANFLDSNARLAEVRNSFGRQITRMSTRK